MGPAEMGPERKGEKLSGTIFVILTVKIGQHRSISDNIGQIRTTFDSQKLSAITFVNSSRFFAISLRPHLGRPHLALPNFQGFGFQGLCLKVFLEAFFGHFLSFWVQTWAPRPSPLDRACLSQLF